jgi:hypothetical protein
MPRSQLLHPIIGLRLPGHAPHDDPPLEVTIAQQLSSRQKGLFARLLSFPFLSALTSTKSVFDDPAVENIRFHRRSNANIQLFKTYTFFTALGLNLTLNLRDRRYADIIRPS